MQRKSPTHGHRPFFTRTLTVGAAVVFAGLAARAAAAPIDTPAASEINPWRPSGTEFYISEPLRLNLGFFDQKGTPRVAEASSLQPDQIAGLPGVAQVNNNELLRAGHFDALWNAMKAGVCKDVQNSIQTLVNTSPNTAYDIQPCIMNPKGYLMANFQETWETDPFTYVNGRRVRFNYIVPFNGVIFWVTSPHTCHHGDNCPTEPQDPVYSFVFTVIITITCTPAQLSTTDFSLPVSCTDAAEISGDALLGGDVTGQLTAALVQWGSQTLGEAASVAATGGASLPEAAAAFLGQAVNVGVKGIGALFASVTDEHLRDHVSAALMGFVGSQTLAANAVNINHDFNVLFQNLYDAYLAGLRPFAVAVSTGGSFDFGLVYPLPAKPQIENKTAANNVSLFAPTIAVSQPEVVAGQTLPVTATFFKGNYVNTLTVAWNKTVLGATISHLTWGPPQQTITTSALTYDATDLKPSTGYGFYVQECDAITCAPTSELLKTATEAAGSGDITFWLDNNTTQKLGSTVASAAGGSFQTSVLIPAATTPGVHLLHAGGLNSPVATATITVCQVGGCAPSVAVVNTSNGTLYPPGSVVEVGLPVVLRGSKFTPGNSVAIFVDTIQGAKAGTAPVGPLGNFQANFTMPMVAAGQHKLLAVEAKPGSAEMTPMLKGGQAQAAPRPLTPADYVTAAVAVYVQAQAQ